MLATIIDMLAFGPTLTRGWVQPHKDSVTSYALNSAKFVPSLLAMEFRVRRHLHLPGDAGRHERGRRDPYSYGGGGSSLASVADLGLGE